MEAQLSLFADLDESSLLDITNYSTNDAPVNDFPWLSVDGEWRDADIESIDAATTASLDAINDCWDALNTPFDLTTPPVVNDIPGMEMFSPGYYWDVLNTPFDLTTPPVVAPSPQNDECELHPTVLNTVVNDIPGDVPTTRSGNPLKKNCRIKVAVWLIQHYGASKTFAARVTGLNPHDPKTMNRILNNEKLQEWKEEVGLSDQFIPLEVKRFIPDFEPTERPDMKWENAGRGCSCGTAKPQRLQINVVYKGNYGSFVATGYKEGRCYEHGTTPKELDFAALPKPRTKRKTTSAATTKKKRSR